MGVYAVIKTGGKQYRVAPGDIVQVEKLPVSPGDAVEITDVFMLVKDDDVAIGNPTVANVRVIAEVVAQGRGEKIRIFKKRRRKHYQKTMGHRQHYSAIRILEIVDGDRNYRASDADTSSVGLGAGAHIAASAPDRGIEAKRPESLSVVEDTIPAPSIGASPVFAAVDHASVAETSPAADTEPATPAVEPAPPASTAIESISPITPVAVIDEAPRPDVVPQELKELPPAALPDSREPPEEAAPAQPFAVVDIHPEAAPTAIPREPLPVDADGVPRAAKPRRQGMFWFLAPLLALLLGGLGWWLKSDEKPASVPVGADAPPASPAAHTAPTPPVAQAPVRERSTRKPAPAQVPTVPGQPPD